MPLLLDLGTELDCIVCDGKQRPTAEEYVSHSSLGVVNELRQGQINLTQLIDTAVQNKQIVVAEAGTGLGKSFSYLLPAILSGKKVVVSTAKKSLQSQLIEKDLPYLANRILPDLKYEVAYGKGNYACRRAIFDAINSGTIRTKLVKSYDTFLNTSTYGLWEDQAAVVKKKLPVVPASSKFSAEQCVGARCSLFSKCGYIQARKNIINADVVVTNHWLVGYSIRVFKEQGVNTLGDYRILMVDEAHKFEDGIRAAFTEEIKENEIYNLMLLLQNVQDALHTQYPSAGIKLDLVDLTDIQTAWQNFFDQLPSSQDSALPIDAGGIHAAQVISSITRTTRFIRDNWHLCLNHQKPLSPEVRQYIPTRLGERLLVRREPALAEGSHKTLEEAAPTVPMQIALETLENVANRLTLVCLTLLKPDPEKDDNTVTYIESSRSFKSIKLAPIDIGRFIQSVYPTLDATAYVSATLAVNNSMDTFKSRVGLSNNKRVVVSVYGSAFNYDKQALLYISKNVPEANRSIPLANEIRDLTRAINGNTFVLFTAKQEMLEVYDYLRAENFEIPILMQTTNKSPGELLKLYRATPNCILFGLKSFWEGVDIQGDKLSLVIIAKLPFPGRNEPITKAKRDKAGKEWFSKVDMPDMIIDLRQGIGRLIRSKTDRGVIAILDQRLITKRYKNQVLNSLGIKNVTVNQAAVLKALTNLATNAR